MATVKAGLEGFNELRGPRQSNRWRGVATALLTHLASINDDRVQRRNLPPISFAEIARAVGYSKATVASVCIGTYRSSTSGRIAHTILAYLNTRKFLRQTKPKKRINPQTPS